MSYFKQVFINIMTQVQALNYTAHAIEDLKEIVKKVAFHFPQSSRAISRIIELLRESQKFILPNCSDIFEPEDFQQQHLDLFHLPYPVCTFEAPWIMDEKVDEKLPTVKSTRRIALAVELNADHQESFLATYNNFFLNKFPQGGVYVIPLFWVAESGWEVLMGGMFIPYDNTISRLSSDDINVQEIAFKAMHDAGRLPKAFSKLEAEPFVILPEVFEYQVNKNGESQSFQQILLDSHDEITCVVQACAVLNCENINTAIIDPIIKSNLKRAKNNKEPFFSYHVLQINDKTSSKNSEGGSHRSPRSHLRRGHIRRLANKVVWVRSAMINANSKDGKVVKEYKLP
jgi:hypothetical protein